MRSRPARKRASGSRTILEAIVKRIPPPKGIEDHLRGLVFDAQFDPYRGVVAYVRVVDGELAPGMKFMSMAHQRVYEATEVGVFKPEMRKTDVARSATSATSSRTSSRWANGRRRHDHDADESGATTPLAGYQADRADGVLRPLSERRGRGTPRCATRSKNSRSTIRRCISSPRVRSRWGSVSAAVSWGCCTWRSCKSGWSATTTSI